MDSVDKVIWSLPILGFLDVLSTLYVASLGYPLESYEVGFFASLFVRTGLTYVYTIIYLPLLSAFAYVLWFIKNKGLNPTHFFDKVLFLLLIGLACYVCTRLTAALVGNFLLPYAITGRVSWFLIILLTYLSTALALSLYLWSDTIRWMTPDDFQKE